MTHDEARIVAQFPDQNPHPVLRVGDNGKLLYANAASQRLLEAWSVAVGDPLPAHLADELSAAAGGRPVIVTSGLQTFSVLAVSVPELGFTNLYGTDITARTVIERFPERNPFPVMRLTAEGILGYANAASAGIVAALDLRVGEPFPASLLERLREAPVQVSGAGRTFALHCVPVPEAGFLNIYGADVTAQQAMTKFPDQNPHPVLRFGPDGVLLYANPAAEPVRRALQVSVGDRLPPGIAERLDQISADGSGEAADGRGETLEIEAEGRLYALIAVRVFEFGFTNVYGTDVTAAREVERANAENERLLLNILPESIARRLRSGEMLIADRVEEMSVLFADVVDFSTLSRQLAPGDLVSLLNEVFSIFDELSDRYGLEKIKTIGDAYMVVGGLAPNADDHCGRVANLGLDMLAAVTGYREESGIDLHIRVGMHLGPAVAGVVGVKKFIYDVWGETVNTASRMESHGVADRIQVSEATYQRLRDRYRLEPRGPVEIRGRGPMPTWFLEERLARIAGPA